MAPSLSLRMGSRCAASLACEDVGLGRCPGGEQEEGCWAKGGGRGGKGRGPLGVEPPPPPRGLLPRCRRPGSVLARGPWQVPVARARPSPWGQVAHSGVHLPHTCLVARPRHLQPRELPKSLRGMPLVKTRAHVRTPLDGSPAAPGCFLRNSEFSTSP